MSPLDTIAEGLAYGMDKAYFANRYLGDSIRQFMEKEGLPLPLNPVVRQGEYRVSPRSISMPEVMGALERAGFKLHRRWQYKSSGVISSFYEGTFGSIGVHCDWECKWNSPEAGSFTLYFRPPDSVTQTHWNYLAYYEKESFPQHLAEISAFLHNITRLSDEFEALFAKAEKKLSIRKTMLASMLRSITAEPGLRYDLQPDAHCYRLLVGMPTSRHCLQFRLPPPADAAQVKQMMEQTRLLIRELPEFCALSPFLRFASELGPLPDASAKRRSPLSPPQQRLHDALAPLCERKTSACSISHRERFATLGMPLRHKRHLWLHISHSIPDKELAALPARLSKLCRQLNAAGRLQLAFDRAPADICWTKS